MLDIIIEDDTFRPIWDITHAGYKIHNKCPFYEDIRQRLITENYKVESGGLIFLASEKWILRIFFLISIFLEKFNFAYSWLCPRYVEFE